MAILACLGGGEIVLALCGALAITATPVVALAVPCWLLARCLCR